MYTIPNHLDGNKVFLVKRSELDGRLDPFYVNPEKKAFFSKLIHAKNIVKLKDIISEGSYGILPPGDSYDNDNPIKFIRATELKPDLQIDYDNVNFVEEKYYGNRANLKENDILLAVKGATIASNKCVALVKNLDEKCIVNGSIFRFQVKKGTLSEYIAYTLNSELLKQQMRFNLVANNAVDYLDKALIYNLLIPVPSRNMQQRIVDIYNQAYEEKQIREEGAKALLASIDSYLLNELGVSHSENENTFEERIFITKFSEVSGGRLEPKFYTNVYINNEINLKKSKYPLITVSKITSLVSDGTHFTPKYVKSGVKFISVKDVRKSTIDFNNSKYITSEEADLLDKRCKPQIDDILLTKVGTIGLASVVNTDERFQIFVSVALLRPIKTIIRPKYLEVALNSTFAYLQYDRIVKGSGVPDLHLEDIRNVKIPLPPLDKQDEIAEYIQEIRLRAKALQEEAQQVLEIAKMQVEQILLGDEN